MKRDAKSKKGTRLKKCDSLTKLCVTTARKSSGDVENGRVESTSSRILSRLVTIFSRQDSDRRSLSHKDQILWRMVGNRLQTKTPFHDAKSWTKE